MDERWVEDGKYGLKIDRWINMDGKIINRQ